MLSKSGQMAALSVPDHALGCESDRARDAACIDRSRAGVTVEELFGHSHSALPPGRAPTQAFK